MNRHAYFILAYNNPNQLKLLINLLDDERNDIYVHIDKDSKDFPMEIFEGLTKKSELILAPRISIYWAEYSQVELQFRMLKMSRGKGYSYYHFLTGMDLPLKTQDEIHAFFDKSKKEYIGIVPHEGDYHRRHVRYAFPLLKIKQYHYKKILRGISEAGATLQQFLGVDRTKKRNPEKWTLVDGWDWFSITDDFAEYVLTKESIVKELFCMAKCPSEMAFQTVAFNSEFKDRLANVDSLQLGSERLIDWQRGKPYVFRASDYNELITSPRMFGRKFDERIDNEIIEKMATFIKSK